MGFKVKDRSGPFDANLPLKGPGSQLPPGTVFDENSASYPNPYSRDLGVTETNFKQAGDIGEGVNGRATMDSRFNQDELDVVNAPRSDKAKRNEPAPESWECIEPRSGGRIL